MEATLRESIIFDVLSGKKITLKEYIYIIFPFYNCFENYILISHENIIILFKSLFKN